RLHAGWAAHAGVVAALLAQAGFTSPRTVFEGTHGFYQGFAGGAPDPARLTALGSALGREWAIERLMFKAYPCGSINQPYMDCAARIRTRPGFDPTAIRAIVCRTAEGPVHRLWEPLAEKRRPTTPYRAAVSLPDCTGLGLGEGRAGDGPLRPRPAHAVPAALHRARPGGAWRRARAGGDAGRAAGRPRVSAGA